MRTYGWKSMTKQPTELQLRAARFVGEYMKQHPSGLPPRVKDVARALKIAEQSAQLVLIRCCERGLLVRRECGFRRYTPKNLQISR